MTQASGLADPLPLRRRLLSWYDSHRRELPWRDTTDPWAILVSETMLQQTTVAAATPYYLRFLERWPRAADLAAAAPDELLAEWAGLGYYGRAHRLQAAAQIVAESGGQLPHTRDELRQLPGIGDYTAAAVASIAFGESVAAVDGNVERVICRLAAISADPRRAAGRRLLHRLAESCLDPARPGDSNQALIELGATICRPRSPRCQRCPLEDRCQARAQGDPERFPRLPPRRPTVKVTLIAAVIERRGRWLMSLRDAAPNAGFAQFPSVEVPASRYDGSARPCDGPEEWQRGLARAQGLTIAAPRTLPVHRHVITHHRISVHPFSARLISGRPRAPLFWWDAELQSPPLTTATRRILAAYQAHSAEPGEAPAPAASGAQREPR